MGFAEVPFGTDICFDGWCASVTGADHLSGSSSTILHVTMSNHARGIAQKPDNSRIHLIDDTVYRYAAIKTGSVPLHTRLQLHESLKTTLTFSVSKNAKGLKALIEEGPFIANFVFPGNQQVFLVR